MNESLLPTELSAFLANLTTEPGVYRMLNAEGIVLYVGKATHLKSRVNSYFTQRNISVKTRALVSQIHSIEISVTRSETEALLLESTLIKSLRPKYNILMRDDKSYPFIHVSTHHPFPQLSMVRRKKSTAALSSQQGMYFGPYPSGTAVRETIQIIQKVFKIRLCNDSFFSARSRPCLQYQIQRCSAPCTAFISAEAYQRSVNDAVRFLQGKSQQILEELAARMDETVAKLAFEEAAILRDQIKSLRLVQEQQGVVQWRGELDVIVLDVHPGFACIQCVTVREGQVLSSERFFPSVPKYSLDEQEDTLWQQVFSAFVTHHYLDNPQRIPKLILTDRPIEAQSALEELLAQARGKSCHIQAHPRGVNARWLDFSLNNLRLAIAEFQASAEKIRLRYQALNTFLKLEKPISHMECFDVSHTQGTNTIASCVVFDERGPCKRDYRRFNINGITPGDDYAAMEQALMRRFKRQLQPGSVQSDVLIIDGGKAQVAVAKRVLETLGIEGVTLLGIAKGPSRKAGWERLILASAEQEFSLPMDSPALHLLQHIRDEAHRFAITAHRKKRQKTSMGSSLDTIEGVGPKRRQALLTRFGGLRELTRASIEEIAKVHGINHDLASRIYQHFH